MKNVTGIKAMKRKFESLAKKQHVKAGAAIKLAGLHIQAESMRTTPRDTSNLASSHYIDPQETGWKWTCTIGLTSDYAVYVHEMPEKNNFSATGTGPKFLEKAMYDDISGIMQVIWKAMKI